VVEARFIGGVGRCGTSLLIKICSLHPEVAAFYEPRFISDPSGLVDYVRGNIGLARFRRMMGSPFLNNLIQGLKETTKSLMRPYSGEAVMRILDETMNEEDRLEDARAFTLALLSLPGRRYWVEKTPHTVRYVDVLHDMFGEGLRYIHAIREPKDMLASFLTVRWGPKDALHFAQFYREIMADAEKTFRKVPPRCYRVVELETLVAQPQNVIPSLFGFLEIPCEPGWVTKAAGSISPADAHVGRYVRELSLDEQDRVNLSCRDVYETWRQRA